MDKMYDFEYKLLVLYPAHVFFSYFSLLLTGASSVHFS